MRLKLRGSSDENVLLDNVLVRSAFQPTYLELIDNATWLDS